MIINSTIDSPTTVIRLKKIQNLIIFISVLIKKIMHTFIMSQLLNRNTDPLI